MDMHCSRSKVIAVLCTQIWALGHSSCKSMLAEPVGSNALAERSVLRQLQCCWQLNVMLRDATCSCRLSTLLLEHSSILA